MRLDPTIIRTKTSSSLVRLLTRCKKYLMYKQDINTEEADDLLYRIRQAEKVYEEEKNYSKPMSKVIKDSQDA